MTAYFQLSMMAILLLFLPACAENAPAPKPVSSTENMAPALFYLVRHAEKADDGSSNPPLNAKGEARAKALQEMLSGAGIDAIYTTPYLRNTSTVQPLADSIGLPAQEYDPNLDLVTLIDSLRAAHPGERVLICGHSNTVPGMLNVLAGRNRYEQLGEMEYDFLFLAAVPPTGPAAISMVTFSPATE
ncbi:SixA phosphatase family protein [Phaeodactylibacter luteus]|uniref:Histidine phosphatase family protein n=1 Tax=Phaeodactylibacter luteus TaxID=1564516 RepID=A0A5C6RNE3_9BACT|nr:phosphoglycerate mutase family protein [Phaeodactylibacter luteus]TXB62902.1 histidine phosphatase family protein [Phaeodactylibacter luteus]